MPQLVVQLQISADEMLEYYRGAARTVHATALNGQTVNFPASALQRHVTEHGVHGRFRLVFDEQHKFLSLDIVDPATRLDQQA